MRLFNNDGQIVSLTSLRGIAAVIVLLVHAANIGGVPAPNAVGVSRGYLSVDVFFLLSGFVLARGYGTGFDFVPSGRAVRAFLWARFARIYPVHLLMLALLLPLYGIDTSFSGIALLKNLTLTQAPWSVSATWNYPAWSISAEWHAYLLFPFVVAMLLRGSVPSIARMMFYGIVSLSVVAWTYDGLISVATGPLVLLRVLPEFFAGIVLFRLYTNRHGEWLGRDSSSIGLAALIVASTLVPHTDLLIIVALLPALVLSVAYNSGRVSSLLCWAPFRFLGHISYSVYMVQMIPALLIAFHRPLLAAIGLASVPGEAIVYIGLSVAFGTAISLLIEHPGRRWLRPLLPVGRGDALLSSRAVPSAEN